jgi:oligopeptide transport system ATP-binding protein
VFYRAAHPYTLGLNAAMPSSTTSKAEGLKPIEGTPPDLFAPPEGCGYFARCPHAMRLCGPSHPPRFDLDPRHDVVCWLHHPGAPQAASGLYRRGGA